MGGMGFIPERLTYDDDDDDDDKHVAQLLPGHPIHAQAVAPT